MWQKFFQRLETKLFTSIAYYSQTNEISKRINQMIKIAIRFFIINYSNVNFVLTLFSLQTQLNNSINTIIDLAFNEINYNFKIREAFFNLTKQKTTNLSTQRLKYWQKATNVLIFANVKAKIYYDARHIFLLFKLDDYIYLRLHHEYQLSKRFNKKISQQRCDSFLIKRRIDWLVYELKLFFA